MIAPIALLALAIGAAAAQESGAAIEPAAKTTEVRLPSGRVLELEGEWELRKELWGDHALVIADTMAQGSLRSLDAGTSESRMVLSAPWFCKTWCGGGAPVWSDDGAKCFAWIDGRRQLVAIDEKSASFRSLTDLPSKPISWCGSSCNPRPLVNGPAVAHDAKRNRVVFVVEEDMRRGFIVAVRIASGSIRYLSAEGELPNPTSWAFARGRGELYIAGFDDQTSYLRAYSLDGKRLRDLPNKMGYWHLALSPDERTLVAEKQNPAMVSRTTTFNGVPIELPNRDAIDLIDLDTLETSEGPALGHHAAWSFDGLRFAYRDRWCLHLFAPADKSTRILARVRGTGDKPLYSDGPVWSPDGQTLAFNIGEPDATVILDVDGKRVMILRESLDQAVWAPNAEPFADR